jgi:hypothetical protein
VLFARDRVTDILANMQHKHVIIFRQEEVEKQAAEGLPAFRKEREKRVRPQLDQPFGMLC